MKVWKAVFSREGLRGHYQKTATTLVVANTQDEALRFCLRKITDWSMVEIDLTKEGIIGLHMTETYTTE